MRRHELREQVFKLLFRIEFNTPEDMPEQLNLYCNGFGEDNCCWNIILLLIILNCCGCGTGFGF